MKLVVRLVTAALFCSALSAAVVVAQKGAMARVEVLPAELRFSPQPNGTLQAPVVGDSTKPGLYAIRTRIPGGTRVLPHSHPDDRIVVGLSGTLYLGYGERFDETKMQPMPVGSAFSEPANGPHFTWAKNGGVVVHITGVGPTGTTDVAAKTK